LLSKGICLANIVKIESIKIISASSLQNLFNLAEESIKIANNLGEICTSKNWYNEINDLKVKIKEKMNFLKLHPGVEEDLEKLRSQLENNFNNYGNEEFLRFLLSNHPYDGCQFSKDIIEEFKNNKRTFLKELLIKYKKTGNTQNAIIVEKNQIIEFYIKIMINCLSQ